jgi:hypothetical protein
LAFSGSTTLSALWCVMTASTPGAFSAAAVSIFVSRP